MCRALAVTKQWRIVVGLLAAILASSADLYAEQDSKSQKMLSGDEVLNVLEDEDWILVDTRSSNAYNGWQLDGIKRGGHLPGAVDFPASWLESDREDKAKILSAALRAKGIAPHRHVVLYGTDQEGRDRVAEYLGKLGFDRVYDFDFNAWTNDATKPLVRYKNFQLLLPASIVKQLLDDDKPETFGHVKRLKFAEVSWGEESASYLKGHVPRSFHVNTDHFEPPPEWMLGKPIVLLDFARKYGFHVDDTVVLSGADPTASYRLAIVLRYMGVEDVRVLNGGFAAWRSAGYPVETASTLPTKTEDFGVAIPARPQLIDNGEQVRIALQTQRDFTLVDTRNWAEFTGKTSGYKYHKHKGRIPGSVYGQADFKGQNSLTPYRNIDNTMRNADEILMLWKQSEIDTEKHLSFMCGGGWRAAEVLTFANVIGLTNTSLYSDGWIGWSNERRNRP